MDDRWAVAIGALAIGIMAGLAGAGLLYRALTSGRREDAVYRDSARAMAISCFIFFTVAGGLVALSILNEDSFEDVPSQLVDLLPSFLAAGLILVGGRAIALAAGSVVQQSLQASSARVREQAARLVRWTITAAAIVIALAQVGVNTTLLQIIGGALLFGLALSCALLVGLGGQNVAAEVAAGRYITRILQLGDHVEIQLGADDVVRGEIIGLDPGSVAIALGDGSVRHVGNRAVLNAGPKVLPD
jgi:hypothetical protein